MNACLQLVHIGLDYDESASWSTFTSELGKELLSIKDMNETAIYPSNIKSVLVKTEDKRIASMLSDVSYQVLDEQQMLRRTSQINRDYLNLDSGQQCVRDFFFCIQNNLESWPVVYSHFSSTLKHSTTCPQCKNVNEQELNED